MTINELIESQIAMQIVPAVLLFILMMPLAISLRRDRQIKRLVDTTVPQYNENTPFYVALNHEGYMYSMRLFSCKSNFKNSDVLREWVQEGAVIKALSENELESYTKELAENCRAE